MLLHILRHQPGLVQRLLDLGKEELLFLLMVMIHGFVPALTVGEKIRDVFRRRDRRGLNIDGIEGADEKVVSKTHLRCDKVLRYLVSSQQVCC